MADLQDPSKHPDFYTWTWDVWVSGGNWRAEFGWEKPQRGPRDTRIIRNTRPLYTRPSGVMAAPQPAPDEALEALIEESGGYWKEDVFCIEGGDLMNLMRAASTSGVGGTDGR